ncbi:hypothetical protein EEL32_00295 (plasmid) [Brevibacillus laterosporus]|nr:hypothetical protein [Brevibacillus laterosporus]TPG93530.1 hypothetical protein EEL32_00295 [Brevibacillus laterosporus]
MKTVVFRHKQGYEDFDLHEEEFEFADDATEEEIQKEFEEWVWNIIGDYFTWYEKGKEEANEQRD